MKRAVHAIWRLTPLIRTGLIAGLVVAALAYPVIGVVGVSAKAGAEAFEALPTLMDIAPSPQTSYVYANDGRTLITEFYEENRKSTTLDKMSPWIQEAIVAAEDSRFYEHHGVDIKGTVRAFVANQQAGEVSQGASTLTMQYVRNALRDAATTPQQAIDATAQDSKRKLKEMKLAIELEKKLTKKEILRGYLNVAYFGHQAYGIAAAADVYFSTTPADLTLDQAALIAGLVQAPSTYDPASADQSAALNRRNYVIDRMADHGDITSVQAATAKATPMTLHLTQPPDDCLSVPANHNDWGFFCDELKEWWAAQPAFGATVESRMSNLRRGGYTIVTTLDPKVQQSAMAHIVKDARIGNKYALGAVFLQPGTGQVRAMAVNRVYSLDQSKNPLSTSSAKRRARIRANYPNTVDMLLGGGPTDGYQAGSTFKFFTMLAALERGLPLSTSFYAPQRLSTRYVVEPGGPASCGPYWCPVNASKSMTGNQNMWSGWGKSVNTYWVQVEEKIGAQRAVAMAERLGLTWHNQVDKNLALPNHAAGWGAFTLGVADTTPLEMAGAYATAPADGLFCQPLPAQSIIDLSGKEVTDGNGVAVAAPRCRQAVTPTVARAAVDAMRCTTGYQAAMGPCGGWSTAPSAYRQVGRPFAGKTGTTDDTRAAWFIGYTPQLAGAAFVADPDNPFDVAGEWQYNKPIDAVTLTIHDAMQGKPVIKFTPPPVSIARPSITSKRAPLRN
jgi:membrane peptidoglycan carboxypeptidase